MRGSNELEPSSPLASTLLTLPAEVVSQIISCLIISKDDVDQDWSQLYPLPTPIHGWSFYLYAARSRRLCRATAQPVLPVLLSCRKLHDITTQQLRTLFTGCLVFTTAATPWRTLTKLRLLATKAKPVGWYLNNIRTLIFRAPPLFTSRIPWAELPGTRLVVLDYSSRRSESNLAHNGGGSSRRGLRLGSQFNGPEGNATNTHRAFDWFRITHALESSGELDEVLVKFVNDTERFDLPLIDDAKRVSGNIEHTTSDDSIAACHKMDTGESHEDEIEVRIVKVLKFLYLKTRDVGMNESEQSIAGCFVRVVASHWRDRKDITLSVLGSREETGDPMKTSMEFLRKDSTERITQRQTHLIWTSKDGLLRTLVSDRD